MAEANGNDWEIHCRPIYGADENNKNLRALAKQIVAGDFIDNMSIINIMYFCDMSTIVKKSIFDMTPEEFHEYLKPVAVKLKQTALDNGLWNSYKNELCVKPDMFIHEFKNGRKELIQLGKQAGEYTILRGFY